MMDKATGNRHAGLKTCFPGLSWLLVWGALAMGLLAGGSCTGTRTRPRPAAPASDASAGARPEATDSLGWPASFGFGTRATPAEIALLDIAIRPDGRGLPAGSGTVATGRALYATRCAACHGPTGTEGPQSVLVALAASPETTQSGRPAKAIGNYWPYAPTLFDYIRRAMPFNAPGSLTDEQVYSLTAFLLEANKIIPADAVLDARTLPQVVMPAQKLFVPDDRQGGKEIR